MDPIRDTIITCMKDRLTLKLAYIDRRGETKHREVEPCSFSEDGITLFAFCCTDKHVKQFKLEGILSAEPGSPFVPSREIKIP